MPGKVVGVLMVGLMVLLVGGAIVGVTPLRGVFGGSPGVGVASAPAPAPAVPAAQPKAAAQAPAAQPTPAGQPTAPAQALSSPGEVTEVTITASDLKFEPATLNLPVGKPVRVTFHNKGALEHDWQINGITTDVTVVSAPSGLSKKLADQAAGMPKQGVPYAAAAAGQRMVIEFTLAGAGAYEMVCWVPGHKEAGMKGTVVVGDGKGPAVAAQPAAPAKPQVTVPPAKAAGPLPRPQIAPPLGRTQPATVKVDLETREITATLADGVTTTMWTFEGTTPGPMIRVMQGDSVEITLRNAPNSEVTHSIDSHGVTGPGGGAQVTQTKPGGRTAFRFEALNPGVYVYHCATAPVAQHIANGMYGLMVVEPKGGLPKVDREYYVMQGDFYLQGERGQQGHREFSLDKLLTEDPDYVLFNGLAGGLSGEHALKAKVGETVRIFFGVGGPNLISSFHVIGEIFDRVSPEGASEPQTNIQTTLVPAGGATMVEFKLEVPGRYVLVDHSLGRLQKGNGGYLEVDGPANPRIFEVIQGSGEPDYGH